MRRQWYEVVSPGDAVIAFAMTDDIRDEVGWLHAAKGNYAQRERRSTRSSTAGFDHLRAGDTQAELTEAHPAADGHDA